MIGQRLLYAGLRRGQLRPVFSTGPHIKGIVDGKVRPVVQQGDNLSWVKQRTSAECKNCDMLLPVPGRSYERGRKVTPRSSSQPVKTDGHSFNKIHL